jgi:hypothetical protein
LARDFFTLDAILGMSRQVTDHGDLDAFASAFMIATRPAIYAQPKHVYDIFSSDHWVAHEHPFQLANGTMNIRLCHLLPPFSAD